MGMAEKQIVNIGGHSLTKLNETAFEAANPEQQIARLQAKNGTRVF